MSHAVKAFAVDDLLLFFLFSPIIIVYNYFQLSIPSEINQLVMDSSILDSNRQSKKLRFLSVLVVVSRRRRLNIVHSTDIPLLLPENKMMESLMEISQTHELTYETNDWRNSIQSKNTHAWLTSSEISTVSLKKIIQKYRVVCTVGWRWFLRIISARRINDVTSAFRNQNKSPVGQTVDISQSQVTSNQVSSRFIWKRSQSENRKLCQFNWP